MNQQVAAGCFWYILASTFKIGAIFYLPAMLLIVAKIRGLVCVALFFGVLIISHIIIAIPFVNENAGAYFGQNFNIGTRYVRWNSATWSFLEG